MALKLSTLAIVLGLLEAITNLMALINPAAFTDRIRKVPRSLAAGYFLMLTATAWFMWNVNQEPLSDFESIKPYLYVLFVGVGVGACFFVQDFLAVRGLAVILLLLAKLMVDTERWSNTPWRLVIALWAYVMVIAGIWFTVSPWRMRDLIDWNTATPARLRLTSALRVVFGLCVVVLGVTVY
jgi:hypothetical protein